MKPWCALSFVFLVTACASENWAVRQAAKDLNAGIAQYENGNYRAAEKTLRLALEEGLFKSDEIRARKYLAFINCATARESICRGEFERILKLDPKFELTVAEAGHPAWGPVFRRVKAAEVR
jgi:Tfp pilus assembly protein PilF